MPKAGSRGTRSSRTSWRDHSPVTSSLWLWAAAGGLVATWEGVGGLCEKRGTSLTRGPCSPRIGVGIRLSWRYPSACSFQWWGGLLCWGMRWSGLALLPGALRDLPKRGTSIFPGASRAVAGPSLRFSDGASCGWRFTASSRWRWLARILAPIWTRLMPGHLSG